MNQRSTRSHCITEIYIDLPSHQINTLGGGKQSSVISNVTLPIVVGDGEKSSNSAVIGGGESKGVGNETGIGTGVGVGIGIHGDSSENFIVMGRMTLVDLAGSERLKSTQSSGKALQEAGFINKSLYVLGKVGELGSR